MLHPAPEQGKVGPQPDRNADAADDFAVLGLQEGTASRGQHPRRAMQKAVDDQRLFFAEEGFAVAFEDLGDGHVRGGHDLGIAVEKRHLERLGKRQSDGGFARTHHADKGDCLLQVEWQNGSVPLIF